MVNTQDGLETASASFTALLKSDISENFVLKPLIQTSTSQKGKPAYARMEELIVKQIENLSISMTISVADLKNLVKNPTFVGHVYTTENDYSKYFRGDMSMLVSSDAKLHEGENSLPLLLLDRRGISISPNARIVIADDMLYSIDFKNVYLEPFCRILPRVFDAQYKNTWTNHAPHPQAHGAVMKDNEYMGAFLITKYADQFNNFIEPALKKLYDDRMSWAHEYALQFGSEERYDGIILNMLDSRLTK